MESQSTEQLGAHEIQPNCATSDSFSLSTELSGDSGVVTSTLKLRNNYEHQKREMKLLNAEYENAKKELRTLKARLNGFQTISVLLKENVKEKDFLKKKILQLEKIVRIFQNRLFQLGASTSLNLEEDEIFYPSMNKENCEEMAKEICRLQELLKHAAVNPEEIVKLKQEAQEYEQNNRKVEAKLQEVTDELESVRKAMASSDNEKDSEIMQLKSQINTMDVTSSVSESLCQSLNEERENLQQQLQATSQQCRELARRLEDYKRNEGRKTTQADQNQHVIENEQLRLQCNELLLMNTRWQTFNEEQESKILRLNTRIAELESQVKDTRQVPSDEHQRQFDRLLLQAKQRIEEEREEKENVVSDNKALEMALKQEEDERKRLQTLLEAGGGGESRPEDKEHIEFLKAQIQSCTDDFELERQDREKAHERIAALEAENKYLKDRLVYVQQDRRPYYERRQESLNRYQKEYNQHGYDNQLVARGLRCRDVADAFANDLVIDGADRSNEGDDGFDEIDGVNLPPPPKTEKTKEVSSKHVSVENLECPRCGRLYSADKDHEYMTHVDICCD